MAQQTDLYSVMYSYIKKIGSPVIDMAAFISFLEKYAKRMSEEKPEWAAWVNETGKRVWVEANHLAEEGKLIFTSSDSKPMVRFCHYYAELVKQAYKNGDKNSDRSFPDEDSLRVSIPEEEIISLPLQEELARFMENPQQEVLPIIRFILPANAGTILVLASMIPYTLMEFALLKIRNYLLRNGNKDYILRKLAPQLAGKESQLKEIIDQILISPGECLNDLSRYREISFLFWAHFCNLVRTDLLQKAELLEEETAVLQAVFVTEAFRNIFKAKAAKAKETELAFKNLELEMDKPPYYFSQEAIMKFKDNKGMLLLDMYSAKELDDYIRTRTTEPSSSNTLPDLVYFSAGDAVPRLIKKSKVLVACSRLLADTRPLAIKTIYNRWKIMLKEFRKESAMDDDKAFEALLAAYVKEQAPILQGLLENPKLFLIYEEMLSLKKEIPEPLLLYYKNELLPLRTLLNIKRKQILNEVKMLIPFWHILFHDIIVFFKKRKKKKKRIPETTAAESKEKTDDHLKELKYKARELQTKIVPQNHTLDSYLKAVSARWAERLNKQASEDLIEDVNTLIRDRFRHMLRFQKRSAIGKNALDTVVAVILDGSAGLRTIRDQDSLILYIKLYLIKLLIGKATI